MTRSGWSSLATSPHLGPELRQRAGRQRARGVEDDGDGVDALGTDRRQVEARVDEAPVGQAPGIVALDGVGHVAAQQRAPVDGARMRPPDRFLYGAGQLSLGLGEAGRLVHGLVPGLLLLGDIGGGRAGFALPATGGRVHDLASAGRIGARRGVGAAISTRIVAVLRISVAGPVARPAGIIVAAGVGGWRSARGTGAGIATAGRRVALAVVGIGLGQAVIGLFDADAVPGLGVGRQGKPRVFQQAVGHQLGGALPALRVALAPARVVLECAGQHYPCHGGLDDMRLRFGDPAGRIADLPPIAGHGLAAGIGADRQPQGEAAEEGLLAQQCRHAGADAPRRFRLDTGGHHAAFRAGSAVSSAAGPKYPANCSISASASRFTRARAAGSKVREGRSTSGSTPAILSFTCSQRRASMSSPKMLRRGTTSTRPRMFSIIESRKTSGLPSPSSRRRSPTRSTASPRTPVEVADGIVQAFLDLVLDVALDPVGVVAGKLRHEMVRIRHRRDAVADAELSLQRFLRGIVLDAEQLAEVEPGLVDVVLVVLDEAGALAHHALPEAVQQRHIVLVVGDGQQARALVVPGQRLLVMRTPRLAHGGGERSEGGLGQQTLVVAPGADGGLVVDGDMVARLAVVEPARPGADAQGHQHGVVGEVHGVVLPKWRVTGSGRRPSG